MISDIFEFFVLSGGLRVVDGGKGPFKAASDFLKAGLIPPQESERSEADLESGLGVEFQGITSGSCSGGRIRG
jgi:hypothetical protein